jgi:hypothetical protein
MSNNDTQLIRLPFKTIVDENIKYEDSLKKKVYYFNNGYISLHHLGNNGFTIFWEEKNNPDNIIPIAVESISDVYLLDDYSKILGIKVYDLRGKAFYMYSSPSIIISLFDILKIQLNENSLNVLKEFEKNDVKDVKSKSGYVVLSTRKGFCWYCGGFSNTFEKRLPSSSTRSDESYEVCVGCSVRSDNAIKIDNAEFTDTIFVEKNTKEYNQQNSYKGNINGAAVAALILGILSAVFVNSFFIQVAAIITGGIGLSKANELASRGVEKTGRGMAITGLILGGLFLLRVFIVLATGSDF